MLLAFSVQSRFYTAAITYSESFGISLYHSVHLPCITEELKIVKSGHKLSIIISLAGVLFFLTASPFHSLSREQVVSTLPLPILAEKMINQRVGKEKAVPDGKACIKRNCYYIFNMILYGLQMQKKDRTRFYEVLPDHSQL